MKKTIKKPTFKKGDKVKIIGDHRYQDRFPHNFKIGSEVEIIGELAFDLSKRHCYHCKQGIKTAFVLEEDMALLKNGSVAHPLIIKKITKVSRGKKVYTWQFSKNKKVSNHLYNGSSTRNKQLNQFIEDIKLGNYEIQ